MNEKLSILCTFDNDEKGLIEQKIVNTDNLINLDDILNILAFMYKLYTKDTNYKKIFDDLIYSLVLNCKNISEAVVTIEQMVGPLKDNEFIEIKAGITLDEYEPTYFCSTKGFCKNRHILAFIVFAMQSTIEAFDEITLDKLFELIKSRAIIMHPAKENENNNNLADIKNYS